MKKIKAIASGKVQGVAFRMHAQTQAQQLGIKGFVRNLSNGNVEIVAVGEAEKVDALINWAKTGSPSAVVKNLEIEAIDESRAEYRDFQIRR